MGSCDQVEENLSQFDAFDFTDEENVVFTCVIY